MENYFLRWRGEITGPFTKEEVTSLLQDGKISKHHQVSADRQAWGSISDDDTFRDICRPPVAAPSQASPETPAQGAQTEESSSTGNQEISNKLRLAYRDPSASLTSPAIWYVARGDSTDGPFTEQELREQRARRLLTERSLICRENEQTWLAMGELFPELFSTPGATNVVTPAGVSEMISYAGFISRFAAAVIDGMILSAIDFVIILVVNSFSPNPINYRNGFKINETWLMAIALYNIWSIILGWLYFTLSESSAGQATLGKKALGLVVTDESGRRISFGRANGRYFGKIISVLLLYIGFIMVAFTDRKQGLHDIMAGTLVLKKVKYLAPIKEST